MLFPALHCAEPRAGLGWHARTESRSRTTLVVRRSRTSAESRAAPSRSGEIALAQGVHVRGVTRVRQHTRIAGWAPGNGNYMLSRADLLDNHLLSLLPNDEIDEMLPHLQP